MKIRDRVKIIKKDSPIFGKEFIIKGINEEKQTVDLIDDLAQEITYRIKDVTPLNENVNEDTTVFVKNTSSPSKSEILFDFDGTLVDEYGKPNTIVVSRFRNLAKQYSVGILSSRVNDPTDLSIKNFITANLSEFQENIEITSSIGSNTKLIFSSRVVRVTKDGTDFCPMCLVANDYTTYEANILECMFNNIGGPQG